MASSGTTSEEEEEEDGDHHHDQGKHRRWVLIFSDKYKTHITQSHVAAAAAARTVIISRWPCLPAATPRQILGGRVRMSRRGNMTHMYTPMCVYIYIYVHIHIHINTYIHTPTHIYIRISSPIHLCSHRVLRTGASRACALSLSCGLLSYQYGDLYCG